MGVFAEPVKAEPQLKAKGRRKYERVLLPLTEIPNEWRAIGQYKTPSSAYQAALNLRNGVYRIPGDPTEWEFVHDEDKVFAKFVMDENPEEVDNGK